MLRVIQVWHHTEAEKIAAALNNASMLLSKIQSTAAKGKAFDESIELGREVGT